MCVHPFLFSVLFTGPSLLVVNFWRKFFTPSYFWVHALECHVELTSPAYIYQTNLAIMLRDISSYPVTCTSQEAVQLYNKAVQGFVSLREKFLGYLEQAVELDDSFLLAHCFLVGCVIARPFVNDCTKLAFTEIMLCTLTVQASAYVDFRMSPLIHPENKAKCEFFSSYTVARVRLTLMKKFFKRTGVSRVAKKKAETSGGMECNALLQPYFTWGCVTQQHRKFSCTSSIP